ncbi:hypothetical protein GGR57DRAFT_37673 [Xylariaceae sp. FL1272]|nr:hypothetical protein GGR57DRAFT_37673 [Xylariaceae sp. FL1272]
MLHSPQISAFSITRLYTTISYIHRLFLPVGRLGNRPPFPGRLATLGMSPSAKAPMASACETPLEPAAVESGRRLSSTPLTPPHSADSTSSHRQHQLYLDSLEPPSPNSFARLCALQKEREQEHRKRNNDLRREHNALRRQSMEARRDFMHAKTLDDEAQERQAANPRRSMLDRRSLIPVSWSRPSTSGSDVQRSINAPASKTEEENSDGESLRGKAATVIQRTYRGHRVRREMQGLGIDAGTRWTHAIRDARWNELNKPRPRSDSKAQKRLDGTDRPSTGKSQARQNWIKVATIARRAGADEDSDHFDEEHSSGPDSDEWANMSPEERDAVQKRREEAQAKRRNHARMMGLQYFLEMVDLKHRCK